jgi:acyl-homoserine lactone acylase PvdQ
VPERPDFINNALKIVTKENPPSPLLLKDAHFDDQLKMYYSLEYAKDLSDQDLDKYFKDEGFYNKDANVWETSKVIQKNGYNVTIKRDSFGVPHIFGVDRGSVEFGAGYATGEDRLFLVDILRRAGRGELSQFLGPADFTFDIQIGEFGPYKEEDRTKQFLQLSERFGAVGDQIIKDIKDFVNGVNEYISETKKNPLLLPLEYRIMGLKLKDFKPEDVVAITTLIQALFASGGGQEHKNVNMLNALKNIYKDNSVACSLWNDMRHRDDVMAPTTIDDTFNTQTPIDLENNPCPLEPNFFNKYPGAVMFDSGSFTAAIPTKIEPCGKSGQIECVKKANSSDETNGIGILSKNIHNNKTISNELLNIKKMFAYLPKAMSNAILISQKYTKSGHPIAVFGPQIGYYVPQMFLELSMHGGDIDARGATFPGLPYILIGRGIDYAWSTTSGLSDMADEKVLYLCNDKKGYIKDNKCIPFDIIHKEWTAKWNISVPVTKETPFNQSFKITRLVLRSPEYGPVIGFATVNGKAVAITRQRTTYMGELDTAVPFLYANSNKIKDGKSFIDYFNYCTGTFNWFYIDDDEIAYIHSGKFPKRASGVFPDLPSWGESKYDFKGYLSRDEHPHSINPSKGYFVSWNNKPARGWRAADYYTSFGPIHRSQLLSNQIDEYIKMGTKFDRSLVVKIMNEASTIDLRGKMVLPEILEILEKYKLQNDQKQALQLLKTWIQDGSKREDFDQDGHYEHNDAIALMDSWYDKLIDATLPQIAQLENYNGENLSLNMRDNAPNPGGTAYMDGYYGYLKRIADMALNKSKNPYRVLKCAGSNNIKTCGKAISNSLLATLKELGGINNKDKWDEDRHIEKKEAIEFMPLGLSGVEKIDWVNRPTFQQVVEPTTHR